MTIQFPRRRFNPDGSWAVEGFPEVSPEELRQQRISHYRGVLAATYPDGRPTYTAAVRKAAEEMLQQLEVQA